jgi:hypothetical protein
MMNEQELRKEIERLKKENEKLKTELEEAKKQPPVVPEGCVIVDTREIQRKLGIISRGSNAKALWAILAGVDRRGVVGMKASDLCLNMGLRSRRGWGELTGDLEKSGLVERWGGPGHVQGIRCRFVPSDGTFAGTGVQNVPAAGTIRLGDYREMYRVAAHREKNVPGDGPFSQNVPGVGTNRPLMYVWNHNIDTEKGKQTYTKARAVPPTEKEQEILRFLWTEIRFHRNGWKSGMFERYEVEAVKEAALALKEDKSVKNPAAVLRALVMEGQELPVREKKERGQQAGAYPHLSQDYSDIIES